MNRAIVYLFTSLLGVLAPAGAQTVCSPLSREESERIEQFLRNRDASIIDISTQSITVASGPCYRTIAVTKLGGKQEHLLLSPDHRYLSAEVIDTRPEEAQREHIKREAVNAMLNNSYGRPFKGNPAALIKIDVFSDFQCPYCRQEFEALNKNYFPRHSAEIRITFHQNPLAIHPWALRAAELTECANEQQNALFWTAHDFLFEHQSTITPANIDGKLFEALSRAPGFLPDEYHACASRITAQSSKGIDNDRALAASLDVRGTPTMFINGLKISGTPPVEQIDTLIRELSKADPKPAVQKSTDVSRNPPQYSGGESGQAERRSTSGVCSDKELNQCAKKSGSGSS